jgi:hypothetical protein
MPPNPAAVPVAVEVPVALQASRHGPDIQLRSIDGAPPVWMTRSDRTAVQAVVDTHDPTEDYRDQARSRLAAASAARIHDTIATVSGLHFDTAEEAEWYLTARTTYLALEQQLGTATLDEQVELAAIRATWLRIEATKEAQAVIAARIATMDAATALAFDPSAASEWPA